MRRVQAAAAGLAVLALAGCGRLDMWSQRKFRSWDRNRAFANGSVMQHPPAGTVAHGQPGAPAAQPAKIDAALLMRGREQYDINCVPCHGSSGDGQGMIVQRGFPHPPPLYVDRLRKAPAQHFYDVMTNGYGVMYSYADRVEPADRWAVAAYIRALQTSAGVAAQRLEKQDFAALDGKAP